MSVARWRGQEGERQVTKFLKDVLERMSEPPWYSTIAQETNQTVSMKRNVNKPCVLFSGTLTIICEKEIYGVSLYVDTLIP